MRRLPRRIRRSELGDAVSWLGSAGSDGMARLLDAHAACYPKITDDMRASERETALLIANTLNRARVDRNETSRAAVVLLGALTGREKVTEAFLEVLDVEDDDDFRGEVEQLLSHFGYQVRDRQPGEIATVRRVGIDPD